MSHYTKAAQYTRTFKPVDLNTDRDPWTRQKRESHQAFEAFCVYRDMGPARSQTKVAKILGKSSNLINRWCRQWRWVSRAAAWDAEIDRINLVARAEAVKQMQERHASIASEALDRVVERLKSIQSEELTPADTAKWLEVATKIERLSRGEPTEIGKQELSGRVINKHEYDVTEAIEQYADVYRQLEGRGILQSSNASNDSREPVDSAQADVETS